VEVESRRGQGPSPDENSFGNGNAVQENDGVSMRRTGRVTNLVRLTEERVVTGKWSERNGGG